MRFRSTPWNDSAHELDCAKQVVNVLFETTGLSTIVHESPAVSVGEGNWISFVVHQPISIDAVLALKRSRGDFLFVPDFFDSRGKVRSKTSPSLHLTNLGSEGIMRGHVDSYYWAQNPLAHVAEFLRRKTALPSKLLKRLHG